MAQALERIAQRYRAFAIDEARGVSEAYEALALGIATAPEILDFIASVPSDRRQPNLFLAAVRSVCGVPENTTHLQLLLRQEHERIRSVMLSRTTQTNEPARCSVLLPVLARLPQPLALLEVGASAGRACCQTVTGTITAKGGSSRASKAPLSFTAPPAALFRYPRKFRKLSGAWDLI